MRIREKKEKENENKQVRCGQLQIFLLCKHNLHIL